MIERITEFFFTAPPSLKKDVREKETIEPEQQVILSFAEAIVGEEKASSSDTTQHDTACLLDNHTTGR